ncbi:hypothetical protein GIB67_022873 [Kingdonia uniflora]|uniref:Uncharacterized protein n=1 Tax=Kingdonia uniflora TaxID=39325 RepID=A0A7J7P7E3_9MAGN|nr:hypothetical protein GIB67_022873 [Kingdonia uniflora]
MHKSNPRIPFHIWIVNEHRVPSQNSHNFISDFCLGKGLSTTKDTCSGKGLSTTKAGGPLRHNSFPDPEPEYRGYSKANCRGLDPRRFEPLVDDIPQSNNLFETIPTDVPLSNTLCIPQSNVHLSNKPMLTNVLFSNEPILINVPLSIKPEPIIGQTEPSAKFCYESQPEQLNLSFWFKSAVYTVNLYDLSKEFCIGDLYRDRIVLKNHIRAYAVVNKFNLVHVLSNEYKIVMRGSFEHTYQLLTRYFAEVKLVDLDLVFDIQTTVVRIRDSQARKEVVRLLTVEEIEYEDVTIVGGYLIGCGFPSHQGYFRWLYNSVVREGFGTALDSHYDTKVEMDNSPINEVSTSGRTVESKIEMSDSEVEVGLEQFLGFLRKLVTYPPCLDAFKEFCKAKAVIGGTWATEEEYFYLLDDLDEEKRERGIDESISLEYFDGSVQSDISEVFLCYLSQLEYGLSLPLTNLAKGIINKIVACPVQLNGNMWVVLSICGHLNEKWENEGKMLKRPSASGTTGSGEVKGKEKRRKIKPSGKLGEKVAEERPAAEDDLKEGEERVRLAALHGDEDMNKMLGVEEEKSELKKAKIELEKKIARAKADAFKDGYSEDEVDAIKADTYVEEGDDEEVEEVSAGVVNGLDGVSRQTVLDNQGDDTELLEGENEKAFERLKGQFEADFQNCRSELERLKKKMIEKDNELKVAQEDLSASEAIAEHLEKVLKGKIRVKEILIKKKDDLLKETSAKEELTIEIERLCVQLRLEKVRSHFSKTVVSNTSRSDLLKSIVAYSVEEVKRLELERDTLFKSLSDKVCICRVDLDRGNCMAFMETNLGPRSADLIQRGRVVILYELKSDRPTTIGKSTTDIPTAEKNS